MSSVVLSGDTSGTITVSAPAVAGSSVQTLAAVTGTLAPIVSGTAVVPSGTSVDFTGIPSWVKRITMTFDLVSTNGSSNLLIQVGSGSVSTSGYTSQCIYTGGSNNTGSASSTAGYIITGANGATAQATGYLQMILETPNAWVIGGSLTSITFGQANHTGGRIALGGALDRVRLTTVNGTDTFDAGLLNILYE